jgi:hypothetical protein
MPPRKRRGRAKKASGGSKKPAFEELREEGKLTKHKFADTKIEDFFLL